MIVSGLMVMAMGALCSTASYLPINKVHDWSWENFWMLQALFGWVLVPFLGAILSAPPGQNLFALYAAAPRAFLLALSFGMLWGIGGLTFGMSMRYLGVALGQSLALGICSSMGVVLTPVATDLIGITSGSVAALNRPVLSGVAVSLVGIVLIGIAGSIRQSTQFRFGKGIAAVSVSGLMSACCNIGLGCGAELVFPGAPALVQGLPAMFPVYLGGFLVNAGDCSVRNFRRHSWGDYSKGRLTVSNMLLCLAAGLLWSTQLFGLCLGRGFFSSSH